MMAISERDFIPDAVVLPTVEKRWDRLTITGLEADLAYFQARLELIGKPTTINQSAQLATFQLLISALNENLERLKRKTPRR